MLCAKINGSASNSNSNKFFECFLCFCEACGF